MSSLLKTMRSIILSNLAFKVLNKQCFAVIKSLLEIVATVIPGRVKHTIRLKNKSIPEAMKKLSFSLSLILKRL